MKTIVLDTNILIDNVHGFATWVYEYLKKPTSYLLVVPTIVIAEYFTAEENETKTTEEKSRQYLALFKIQDLSAEIAEVLGKILRRKTYTLSASLADLIIASTALYLSAPLATSNRKDFAKIPNLRFFEVDRFNKRGH